MNKTDVNPALLPNGFEDLLMPGAAKESKALSTLMALYEGFGYERVRPPKFEFEDSLLAQGYGERLMDKTFRVMDPVTHRMMALSSDITLQVARIATSRLKSKPRPLRLSYAGNVTRTSASEHRTERQFFQVGCEIIGMDDVQADIEACVLAVLGLTKLGMKAVTIDLNVPGLIRDIFAVHDLTKAQRAAANEALAKHDMRALKNAHVDLYGALKPFVTAVGAPEDILAALDGVDQPHHHHVQNLRAVYEALGQAFEELELEDVNINIDPAEKT